MGGAKGGHSLCSIPGRTLDFPKRPFPQSSFWRELTLITSWNIGLNRSTSSWARKPGNKPCFGGLSFPYHSNQVFKKVHGIYNNCISDRYLRYLKSRADAVKHYTGKIDYVKGNLDKLQETVTKKQDNLQYIVGLLAAKEQGLVTSGKEASR